MPKKKYPEEVKDFIRQHIEGRSNKELAGLVNEVFGTDFTENTLRCFNANYSIHRKNRKGYIKLERKVFPDGIRKFIHDNHVGRGPKEMAWLVNETFGSSYTRKQMKDYYGNNGLNSGLTGHFENGHVPVNKGKKWDEYMKPEAQEKARKTSFRKGNVPENLLPLGTIMDTRDGYKIIKVSMKGSRWEMWKLLHRKVWEEHNGPIPEGNIIIFKDGNSGNCDIDNLVMVTRKENAWLNKRGLRFEDSEKTEAGINIVRMYQAVKERRSKKNGKG